MTWAFFVLVAWLLVVNAREIEWRDVGSSLLALPVPNLAIAAALAVASHALYSTYDLISRAYVGFRLPTARVVATTFVSYAFNLNLGSLIGGLGFRFRLYSRQGLEQGDITRTVAFSIWTNWLGYFSLAGALFLVRPPELPPDWRLSGDALRIPGAILLALAVAYLVACAAAPRRRWVVRGHEVELPPFRLAAIQWLVATTNWLLIGAIVWTLLQWRVAYPEALAVLLLGAVAGIMTHVPAGVGVLEVVFVTLLSAQVPSHEILGMLLAYRAIYYLGPLMLAAVMYFRLERRAPSSAGDRQADAR